jgi:hypothetical protein
MRVTKYSVSYFARKFELHSGIGISEHDFFWPAIISIVSSLVEYREWSKFIPDFSIFPHLPFKS